jgi:hypothetical protein
MLLSCLSFLLFTLLFTFPVSSVVLANTPSDVSLDISDFPILDRLPDASDPISRDLLNRDKVIDIADPPVVHKRFGSPHKRQTNAERFARGLPPLPPTRTRRGGKINYTTIKL